MVTSQTTGYAESRRARLNSRRMVLFIALIVASLAAIPNSTSCANSDPLAALIARARVAFGPGLGKLRSTYFAGTIDAGGIRHTFQSWTDRTNGRYSIVVDTGPSSWSEGYDGDHAWWRDSKGIVLPQTGPAAKFRTAIDVFENAGGLFKPDYGGLSVGYPGTRTESGKAYQAIEVRVPGGESVEDWYDAGTALHARQIRNSGGQTITRDFSNYQNISGVVIAFQTRVSYPNAAAETVTITEAKVNIADLEEHLRRPLSAANDFSLPGGETVVPFKYTDHEILVEVRINGKGPFRFALDSGGHNLMDPTVAWGVGASAIGTGQPRGGIGEGSSMMQLVRVGQLSIGGATLTDQYFHIAHIERPGSLIGVQGLTYTPGPQGLIGWEVLARFVTTIDFPTGKIILRMAAPQAPASQKIPLFFEDSLPEFTCRIGGVEGTCLADTGSAASLIVTSPFARMHKDVVPVGLDPTGYKVFGFRGRSRGARGTLASFQMGPVTLTNVEAAFSSDQRGGLANPWLAAIVGNQVWSRFSLTFDYAHATMVVAGNTAADAH